MPKGSRKGKSPTKRQLFGHFSQADFTVNDYANAKPTGTVSGRVSKAVKNAFSAEAKHLVGQNTISSNVLAWYDQASSDHELTDTDLNDENDDGITNEIQIKDSTMKAHTCRRYKKITATDKENNSGVVYPIDLWVVIGDWVHPEDVLLFASICHGSHVVTHTARFWYSMYKRVYNPSSSLPPNLQPPAMDQIHGLCARVVRSLFIMYEPFQQRLQARVCFDKDPECLKGAKCCLMWYQNIKSYWHFFFKFMYNNYNGRHCPLAATSSTQSHKDNSVNIHYNPEHGSCVLQVVTQNFIPIPPAIMGQVLAKTSLSVGHGMRYHKMKLIFTPQHYTSVNSALHSGTTVIMDPVLNTYILNWWHPKYPHQPS